MTVRKVVLYKTPRGTTVEVPYEWDSEYWEAKVGKSILEELLWKTWEESEFPDDGFEPRPYLVG